MLKEFRDFILPAVINGQRKFIIYPYGENGMLVHDYLRKLCDMEPLAIVDNALSTINPRIISYEQLSEMQLEDCCVILTIDNPKVNQEMYCNLKTLVAEEKIINICKNRLGRVLEDVNYKDLLLAEIINTKSREITQTLTKGTKKIRILVGGHCVWNTVLRLAEQLKEDIRFDFLAISSAWDSKEDNMWLEAHNIPYIKSCNYHPEVDKPDVLFLINTGDNVSPVAEMASFAKFVVVMPVVVFMGGIPKSSLKQSVLGFSSISPDYYFLDKYMYKVFKHEAVSGSIIEMGNPKFDDIFYAQQTINDYPYGWEKINGKKAFLWAPDHGICGKGKIIDAISFDKYAKEIFKYFSEHENIALIFRPHPELMRELVTKGYWNDSDVILFEKYCEESPNIIYDHLDSYNEAYHFCDAILVDPHCGMVLSALPLNKPICLTYRSEAKAHIKDDTYLGLEDSYYKACNISEIIGFIEMILLGEDKLSGERMKAYTEYVSHYDGLNSQRIKEFLGELLWN